MMNTYNFTAIVPEFDEGGTLIKLGFNVEIVDHVGNKANKDVESKLESVEPPVGSEYTPEELKAICITIANEKNVLEELSKTVQILRTPVYVPPPPPPPLTDTEKKTLLMNQIDGTVASVYSQFTRFQIEYEQREKAARAYKAAGYEGDPTVWLTVFADSSGISYRMCADLVISQADTLRAAVVRLGELRMMKYLVLNAPTLAQAQIEFDRIMADIAALARSL